LDDRSDRYVADLGWEATAVLSTAIILMKATPSRRAYLISQAAIRALSHETTSANRV
jgi:hypothetical protein